MHCSPKLSPVLCRFAPVDRRIINGLARLPEWILPG